MTPYPILFDLLAVVFGVWASRIVQNWRDDRVDPLFLNLALRVFDNLGLRYFRRHGSVVVSLLYLIMSLVAAGDLVDNITFFIHLREGI